MDTSTPTGPATRRLSRSLADDETLRSLHSTVVVDGRGVVRSVDLTYTIREGEATRTVDRTFVVDDLGNATVTRPEWVCIAEQNGYVEVPG